MTDRRTLAPAAPLDLATDAAARRKFSPTTRTRDEIWISATVKAFRNERGRIKHMFALLSDITRDQAAAVAAAADHGRAGRRNSDHRDRRPALPARRGAIAPDVVASVLHIDAGGLVHPLGGPSLP